MKEGEIITKEERNKLLAKLRHMYYRCYDKKNKNYKYYGGKGIGIYKEWLKDKETFIKWAENNGYKLGMSIERYNNDKDYCPSNCCFIPFNEQSRNTSRNVFIEYQGQPLIISDVARLEDVSAEAIRKRIKSGWYHTVDNPYRLRENPNTFSGKE